MAGSCGISECLSFVGIWGRLCNFSIACVVVGCCFVVCFGSDCQLPSDAELVSVCSAGGLDDADSRVGVIKSINRFFRQIAFVVPDRCAGDPRCEKLGTSRAVVVRPSYTNKIVMGPSRVNWVIVFVVSVWFARCLWV